MKPPLHAPVALASPLTPHQIAATIRKSISSSIFKPRATHPLRGHITPQGCTLRFRTPYRNRFQRVLKLRFTPTNTGTTLEGAFVLRVRFLIGFILWFSTAAFLTLFLTIPILRALLHGQLAALIAHRYIFLLPLSLTLIGALMFLFGVLLSARTEPNILRFLESSIHATPTSPAA